MISSFSFVLPFWPFSNSCNEFKREELRKLVPLLKTKYNNNQLERLIDENKLLETYISQTHPHCSSTTSDIHTADCTSTYLIPCSQNANDLTSWQNSAKLLLLDREIPCDLSFDPPAELTEKELLAACRKEIDRAITLSKEGIKPSLSKRWKRIINRRIRNENPTLDFRGTTMLEYLAFKYEQGYPTTVRLPRSRIEDFYQSIVYILMNFKIYLIINIALFFAMVYIDDVHFLTISYSNLQLGYYLLNLLIYYLQVPIITVKRILYASIRPFINQYGIHLIAAFNYTFRFLTRGFITSNYFIVEFQHTIRSRLGTAKLYMFSPISSRKYKMIRLFTETLLLLIYVYNLYYSLGFAFCILVLTITRLSYSIIAIYLSKRIIEHQAIGITFNNQPDLHIRNEPFLNAADLDNFILFVKKQKKQKQKKSDDEEEEDEQSYSNSEYQSESDSNVKNPPIGKKRPSNLTDLTSTEQKCFDQQTKNIKRIRELTSKDLKRIMNAIIQRRTCKKHRKHSDDEDEEPPNATA